MIRYCTGLGLALSLCLNIGCRSLQPLTLPDEDALPPAQTPLWQALDRERTDNWVSLLNTGAEAIDWRIRLTDSATQSIDLQSFLWLDDSVGQSVMAHLLAAADRGVRIRILLDDTFTAGHDADISQLDEHENIEFRIYNPYSHHDHGMIGRQLFNLGEFSRVDHRMHNKAIVVDNRAAIIGGRNIADEYFGWHPEANFRDLELLCVGESVQAISDEFDLYWNNDWAYPSSYLDLKSSNLSRPRERLPLPESGDARLATWLKTSKEGHSVEYTVLNDIPPPSNPALRSEWPNQLAGELAKIFGQAKKEIIIQSAYLIPIPELEEVIANAIVRGVRVKILTNSMSSNNHLAAHASYEHHIKKLLESGVELYEIRILAEDRERYIRPPVGEKHLALHAKFAVIDDDLSVIGSANLDPRSLRLNSEMTLLLKSKSLNQQLRENCVPDFAPENAWRVKLGKDGKLQWVANDIVKKRAPGTTRSQRLEGWFLGHLPIEGEM